jgi:hypothetical protein
MAAGLGFKTFVTGEVLTAADTNGYLMQGVNVFANAAARTAAITSPQEGQMSYLKDTNSTEYYDGASWTPVSGGGMTLISTTTFSSTSTTISSIPSTYKHLYVVYSELYGNTDNNWLVLRPNNLSTSIYTYHNFSAFNSSNSIDYSASGTFVPVGHMTSSSTGRNKASGVIWIPNYTSTDAIKFITSSSRVVTSTGQRTGLYQGTLDLNSAITSLVFTGDSTTTFTNGKIYLYGVN